MLLKSKTQAEVIEGLKRIAKRVGGVFSTVFKTITADNGGGFLDFEAMKEATNCGDIYYAHPYSSWERGSNENCNRMLRRIIPKGTDLNTVTEAELQSYEDWVNNYPGRILKYLTANEAFVVEKEKGLKGDFRKSTEKPPLIISLQTSALSRVG